MSLDCPCGFKGSSNNIVAHRTQCPSWVVSLEPKPETIEATLEALSQQIRYHRKKAADYHKRAAAQDAIADAKAKECAALGTPELPAVENPIVDGKTYPQLARTAAYPPYKTDAPT